MVLVEIFVSIILLLFGSYIFYSADDCSVLKLLIKNSYKTHSHYTLVCSLGPEGTGEGSQLISSLVLVVFHYSVPSKQRKKVKNSYKI